MSSVADDVITATPASYEPQQTLQDGGTVTVRCLRDTPEDAEFAARMLMEGFHGKIVHCVTDQKLDTMLKILTSLHRDNPPIFYSRNFLAECDGRRAGLLNIKLRNDPHASTGDNMCEVGCCGFARMAWLELYFKENPPRGACYVDHICVDSTFRGKGIGKILMDHAETEARRLNCRTIYLDVTTTNRARHLYERQGFHVTSTKTCCVHCSMGEEGLHRMYKTLEPQDQVAQL